MTAPVPRAERETIMGVPHVRVYLKNGSTLVMNDEELTALYDCLKWVLPKEPQPEIGSADYHARCTRSGCWHGEPSCPEASAFRLEQG